VAPDGTGLRRLVPPAPGALDIPGSWAPDGELLAFTRLTAGNPDEGRVFDRTAVYVVAKDGSGARKLADRAGHPAWSPDGRLIAFTSDRDRNGELSYGDRVTYANELYVMNADGSNRRRLTETRDLDEGAPAWSPDGERIVYERGEVIDNAEGTGVFALALDTGCTREIAYDQGLDSWFAAPAWRPGSGTGLSCPAS
jgi:Tol biopolymer transport system component